MPSFNASHVYPVIPGSIGGGIDSSGQISFQGPIWMFVTFLLIMIAIGFFLGRWFLKRRLVRKFTDQINDTNTVLDVWRHERSATFTYILFIMGFFLFIAGVSGTINIEVPYAKIVTSLP